MEERKRFAIQSVPNPLEFFGYIFCFTCLMAGPAFEYKDYLQGIEGKRLTQNDKLPTSKRASSMIPATRNLLIGIVCLVRSERNVLNKFGLHVN